MTDKSLIQMKKQKDKWREKYRNLKKDIRMARQDMDFQGFKCNNKDCLNEACPLNKVYD